MSAGRGGGSERRALGHALRTPGRRRWCDAGRGPVRAVIGTPSPDRSFVARLSGSRSSDPSGAVGRSAIGRRSKVATRRTPRRSAVATSSASASRGRCSAASAEQLRARGRGPRRSGRRARIDAVGDRAQDGERRRPARARAGGARPARRALSAPSRSGSSARANQATAAAWLRSARSAAASDRRAVEEDRHVGRSAQRVPSAARPRAGRSRRPSSDSRPCPLCPIADEGDPGRLVVLVEVGLDGRGDDRGLGRPRSRSA